MRVVSFFPKTVTVLDEAHSARFARDGAVRLGGHERGVGRPLVPL
ncbi:hypothetical protein [Haloarcula onubensis]|nr:hypothetical protein [Halomicroarcula sp. S3CR25-11]